ncbi:protein of unknown function [Cyanobium sp. NIES-981]|nr:protein of unknown function [Cyanobium sp. NIES-981]
MVDWAHAHAHGDGVPQALVGGGGGHGAMLAAAWRPGQVWIWAARQAGAPAGIPSGVGVQRAKSVYPFVYTPESHGCHPFPPGPAPLGQQPRHPLARRHCP